MLNQHLRNIELQHCECCVNITKYRFKEDIAETSNVESMSYRHCNSIWQHWFSIYSTSICL